MKALEFIALVLTALALVPGGAHLFALPNKIHLAETEYFVTQGIYRGWALLGIVLIAALAANLALAWITRNDSVPALLALAAALCLAATLAIFFAYTFPANQATVNWTQVPDDWQWLRRRWEVSHAVNAAITFVAFCATAASVLLTRK